MNSNEIFKKIIEYGADERGIRDRFGDKTELYVQCFCEFIHEPNLTLLQKAIKSREYDKAFEAAHALKGISGNLGLNDMYNSICILVESLRAKQYEHIEEKYKDFETKSKYFFSKF